MGECFHVLKPLVFSINQCVFRLNSSKAPAGMETIPSFRTSTHQHLVHQPNTRKRTEYLPRPNCGLGAQEIAKWKLTPLSGHTDTRVWTLSSTGGMKVNILGIDGPASSYLHLLIRTLTAEVSIFQKHKKLDPDDCDFFIKIDFLILGMYQSLICTQHI